MNTSPKKIVPSRRCSRIYLGTLLLLMLIGTWNFSLFSPSQALLLNASGDVTNGTTDNLSIVNATPEKNITMTDRQRSGDSVPRQQQHSSHLNGLVNGSFHQFQYQYGIKTEHYEGSFNQTVVDFINETHISSRITTQSLHLIQNFTLNEIYWKITTFELGLINGTNRTRTEIVDNDTFVNVVYPRIYWGLVIGTDPVNITQYDLDWAVIIDQNGSPLLQVPVNVSYYHFIWNDNTSYDIYVQPAVIQVNITLQLYQNLQVNTTEIFAVVALINSTYQLNYDVNLTSAIVNIWHDNSLFLQVKGAGHYSFQYTEISTTFIWYGIFAARVYNLTFSDGTPVPIEMYPLEYLPLLYTQQGYEIEISYQQGTIRGASIQQSILQTYLIPSQYNQSQNGSDLNNSFDLNTNSTQLALWLLQSSPMFIGYKDNNQNGILDLRFSIDQGITIGSSDVLVLLGTAEARERDLVQYYHREQQYNASVQYLNINQTIENRTVNDTFFNVEVEMVGNVTAFPNPVLSWNEPREENNGTYVFNFTIFYDNVPITWQQTNNQTVNTPMDVGYTYVFTISPEKKEARLSPTYYYGSVNLPVFSRPNANISLAVPFLSEFLFIRPVRSVTETDQDLNKSQAADVDAVNLRTENLTIAQINATGAKSLYSVGSNDIKRMKTSGMNLVDVNGVFTRQETSGFALGSESFKIIKNAWLANETDKIGYELQFRSDIYLLNYPTWNGQLIRHDPTFSINYEPPPREEPTPSVVLPVPTFTFTVIPQSHIQSTSSIVDPRSLPSGFALSTLGVTIIGVILVLILSRGRKRLYL